MRTMKSAFTACLLVALMAFTVAGAFAQQGKGINSTFSYYSSGAFAHLTDPAPVFRTTTYHQLLNLFETDGTYMILLGGAWCPNTQAVIGQINDVAKEYGVKTIYNFDTKLDSGVLQIRDTKSPYANLYVDMVNKYLPNIVTIYDKAKNNVSYKDANGADLVANKLQVPFLFLYNRNNKDAKGNPAPIIASYEKMFVWEDFVTNGAADPVKIEAYKKEIRPLFDAVSVVQGGRKVARLDYLDDFDYYSAVFNKNAGATILGAEDNKNWVIRSVSYPELVKILDSSGNYVFMFGGSWCPNTRAVIKYVNAWAAKYDIDTIYNFDFKLDGKALHIRDTKNPYANLYVDLVRKYFPGIVTEYAPEKNGVSYTDKNGKVVLANKLQVPYVFVYNKDRKDAQGNPDPIMGQIELMYTWADMQPAYKDEKGEVGKNYKTYTAALDQLFGAFKASVRK